MVVLSPAVQVPIEPKLWFAHLFGFAEEAGRQKLYELLEIVEDESRGLLRLRSRANGASYGIGHFSRPSLSELRTTASKLAPANIRSTLEHIATRDVFELHTMPEYRGATFMAASQFNCLEFPNPDVVPEYGVTGYIFDGTQGPACALAAAPATVYRNYFAITNGKQGQTEGNQLNNLADAVAQLVPMASGAAVLRVENGYTSSDDERLHELNRQLSDGSVRKRVMEALRIGVHSQVEVPWACRFQLLPAEKRNIVTQAYCSALSCGYSDGSLDLWEPMARVVLEASYEATLLSAAIEQTEGCGSGRVVLTLLGGGVFGNRNAWIEEAIARAFLAVERAGLSVVLAHFGHVDQGRKQRLQGLIDSQRQCS
mmetsp:Transcript_54417/g.125393  ORF Transcript_54417/g.125393 Transcript_54417/m.125393 type:complete len:370 (-) Transcript_54417:201-1310(-)